MSGRTIASNGYVLVRAAGHHLADCRGYAYEHRMVAEGFLGRHLEGNEEVHHRNGDKTDNRPENLEVVTRAEHRRIPILLDTPAAVRFVSYEPALGPVDFGGDWARYSAEGLIAREETGYFEPHVKALGKDAISWVIVGGESGPKHRPFNPDWARSVVRQCRTARVAVFVKQLGGNRPGTHIEDLPQDLQIREFPR